MSDGRVVIDTRIDPKGAVRDVHNLESTLKPALKRIQTMLVTAFSVSKLVQFGRQAVELASDIEEVQNVVDTAFGDMAYKMEEFANTAIETYGISKLTAKRTGSTYMAMAKGLGLSMEEASDMSITLTGLTADMASFYNVSQDVADTAIKSVFTGETESLKRYGIVMTEVNLQEFAYKQGINKKISAMTQAEKVQLRYNYVMSQTTLAQGDFAKTSDSWANQTRILSERWKEFLSIVGTGLIQILTPALRVLNDFLSTMISLANAIAKAFGGNSIKVTKQQKDNIAGIVDTTEDATEATKDLAKAQQGLSKLDELNLVQKETSASTDLAGTDTPIASGIGGIVDATKEVPEANEGLSKLQQILEPLSKISLTNLNNALGNLKTALGKFGDRVGEGLKWFYDNVLVPFAKWTLEKAVPTFLDLLASALDLIVAVWDKAEPALQWLWDNFLSKIASFTADVLIDTLQDFADILSAIAKNDKAVTVVTTFLGAFATVKAIQNAVPLVERMATALGKMRTMGKTSLAITVAVAGWEIGQKLYELITGENIDMSFAEQWQDIFSGLGEILSSEFDDFVRGWNSFWDGVVEGVAGDLQAVGQVFSDIWKNIKSSFSNATEWFGTLGSDMITALKTSLSKISDVGVTIQLFLSDTASSLKAKIQTIIKGVGNLIKNIELGVSTIAKGLKSRIQTVINGVGDMAKNIIVGLITTSNGLKSKIQTVINGIGAMTKSIIVGVVTTAKGLKSRIQTVINGIGNMTKNIAIGISTTAVTLKTKIQNVMNNVTGLAKNIALGISTTANGFLNKINTILLSIGPQAINFTLGIGTKWNTFKNTLKTWVNNIINWLNTNLIGKINNFFKVTIPSNAATKFLGVNGTFQIVKLPKIPQLATGAVLPANNPFLAMVGDQRHGTNIEAPLGTIVEAMQIALKSRGDSDNKPIILQVDGKTLAKVVWDENEKRYKQVGHYAF